MNFFKIQKKNRNRNWNNIFCCLRNVVAQEVMQLRSIQGF